MDTLLLRILMPLHILTVRRISLSMHSRRTATAAESVLGLGTITTAATADTTAVTAGITEVMADTTVDMADITVDTTDITESIAVPYLCRLAGLGKFNLPSLPDKSLKPVPLS